MAEIYGEASVKSLGLEISAQEKAGKEELTDNVPLEGPALDAEQAISQDEIDALFD